MPCAAPELREDQQEASATRRAPEWKVLFHNDDVTPMDFVTAVLMRWFGHGAASAQRVMLTVHTRGIGLAGVYPLELAELKQAQVISAARPHYPLRVTLEEA